MVRFQLGEVMKKKWPVRPTCDPKVVEKFDYSSLHEDLRVLPKPTQRALIQAGLLTREQIFKKTEEQLLELQGFGPFSLPILRSILESCALDFKTKKTRSK